RLARPFQAPGRTCDCAALSDDRGEARVAGVALADRVGSYKAESAIRPQQPERMPEEVRYEISIAMGAFMQCLQPRQIIFPVARDNRILAGERRITDHCVESRIIPPEHFRK